MQYRIRLNMKQVDILMLARRLRRLTNIKTMDLYYSG